MSIIWITWERHRRTIELSSAIPHTELHELILDHVFPPVRYLLLLLRTAFLLLKTHPRIVFVQNPSLILTSFALIVSKLIRFRLIVDAHNEGILPFSNSRTWLIPIYRIIQRYADITIVTNPRLADIVSRNGGTPFVLEDKIPKLSSPAKIKLEGKHNVLFVCTFEKDEPFLEVIKAAALIDSSIVIYITGHYEKAPSYIIDNAPPNVIFTGFVSDQEYIDLLFSCDVLIDLTLMENCLVCGAYEAVSASKPVILSETHILRNYFSKGAIYTENRSQKIAEAINFALENKAILAKQLDSLRPKLKTDWNKRFSHLITKLQKLCK